MFNFTGSYWSGFQTNMAKICWFLVPVLMVIGQVQCRPEDISSTLAEILSSTPIQVVQSISTNTIMTSTDATKTTRTIGSNGTNDSINKIEDGDGIKDDGWEFENATYVDTRRILYSKTVGVGKRPYMVYLQLTKESAKAHKYRGWLCGGVIVEKNYVLTSAACVEDADRFYIVSGTTKFVDSFDYKSDDCICKHRRKVVWKCIPKNYKFDFQDSIKWSSNDIAIVKVEKPFKLGVLEKGCQFAADIICYNNISRELEKPGTKAFIAGWGSGSNFREGVYRRQKVHIPENAKCLQEAKVCIMDNEQCAKKWAQRFRSIITQYMICTKDVMKRLSEICEKKYANCTDVERRAGLESENSQTDLVGSKIFNVDLGRHLRDPDDYTARRSSMQGGFCENDHGGPLIVKYQGKERVIGVISACKIDPKTHSCHGPFLYTSVFKNRQFISCAINKDVEDNCRRVFRTGITHEEWTVSWDDYKEEDGEEKSDKKEEAADLDEDSDEKEKLSLRQKEEKVEEAEKKEGDKEVTTTAKDESDNDSEDTKSTAKPKKEGKKNKKEEKEVKEKKDDKKSNEAKEQKPTHRSKAKPAKRERSHKEKKEKHHVEKSSKAGKEEDKKEVFYESSKDENVNDPDE